MSQNTQNKDVLMNIRGTTCKSFIVGKKEVSFASSAIMSTSVEDLTQYKTLVVKNSDDKKKKVIYDMEINAKAIKYISEEPGGLTALHLMDGTSILIKGSTAGIESDITSDNPTFAGEVVTFADTSGKVITKSGFRIVKSTELPGAGMEINSYADLLTLVELYKQDLALDSKVPTMKAVIDYVGTLESVLELRREGQLPSDNDDE